MTRKLPAGRRSRASRRSAFLGAVAHHRLAVRTHLLLEQLETRVPPGSMLVSSVADASPTPTVEPSSVGVAERGEESSQQLSRARSDRAGHADDHDPRHEERLRAWLRESRSEARASREHAAGRARPETRMDASPAAAAVRASTSEIEVGLDADVHDDLADFLDGNHDITSSQTTAPLDLGVPSTSGQSTQAPDLPSGPELTPGLASHASAPELDAPRGSRPVNLADQIPSLPRTHAPLAAPGVADASSLPVPEASVVGMQPATNPAPVLPAAATLPAQITRLGFDRGLDGWTINQLGGSPYGRGSVTAGSAVLREGDSFLVTLEQAFAIPDNPIALVFTYEATFDTTDPNFINDAFEVALLDTDGYSLAATYYAERDAFFNLTEEMPAALSAATTQQQVPLGQQVTLDVSEVPAGTEARLLFRLVNNDSDTETTVTIHSVDVFGESSPPQVTIGLLHDTAPDGAAGAPYRSDRLTNDPTVTGTATDDTGVARLEVQVNDGPLVDITAALSDGVYVFDPGPLPPGAHRITARATDLDQNPSTSVLDFRVNTPPVADAGGPRTVTEGTTVTFSSAASSDPDGALFGQLWTFHDGTTAADNVTSFTYPQDGEYSVSLHVTDTAGSVDVDIVQVFVSNVAPTVAPVNDLQSTAGATVVLQTSFTDPGTLDTHTAVVDWGDGNLTPATVASAQGHGTVSAQHVYASGGTYQMRVEVTDDAGGTGVAFANMLVTGGETGSLSGYVYLDVNNNGIKDPPEMPLPNVPVRLDGTQTRTMVTAPDGSYRFDQLPAGTYSLAAAQPQAFLDGIDSMGVPVHCSVANDRFEGIQLPAGIHAHSYNFGERGLRPELISKALLLASTPPRAELTAKYVNGSSWWSWQSDAEGMLYVSVPADVRDPVIELYTGAMMPLAIEHDRHDLSVPIEAERDYVLYVAGVATRSFPLSWRIDPLDPGNPSGNDTSLLLINSENPRDVNADGLVTPHDALLVINALNRGSFAATPTAGPYLDVDGNSVLSPRDALLVINHLNAAHAMDGEGEPDPDGPPQTSQGDTLLGPDNWVVFTTSQDFLAGDLFNVNATLVHDQLQLNPADQLETFPFIWISNSGEGTISRFDTRTGEELGRYRTGPESIGGNLSPSRIVVTGDGDAWVANRGDSPFGNVVKILQTGFIDRNGNGVADTSLDLNGDGRIGPDEILLWDANEDGLPDDERIALVVHAGRDRTNPEILRYGGGARGMGVDAQGRLWVGLNAHRQYEVFDSDTGEYLGLVPVEGYPYGATIDQQGILWSVSSGGTYVDRIDTNIDDLSRAYLGTATGRWRLVDPYGQTVFTQPLTSDANSVTLSHDGTYTLLLEGRIHELIPRPYTFQADLLGNQPVDPPAGDPLNLGAIVTGTIVEAGGTNPYVFSLSDRTRVYFDALTNSSSLTWTLTGPKGTLVNNRRFDQSDSVDGLFVLDLVPGTYTLTVKAAAESTDYRFRLADLASATPLTPGTVVSNTLEPGFETDLYRFHAAAGERFYFQMQSLTGGGTNGRWRLIDPTGQPVFTQSLAADVETLAVNYDGPYTLLVEGRIHEPAARDYTFQVHPVVYAEQTLELGTVYSSAIAVPGERDVYLFSLAERQLVYMDSLTNSSALTWTLTGPKGTLVNSRRFDQTDSYDGLFVLDLAPGHYTLTVDGSGATTADYSLRWVDLASAPAIVPGTPVSGELDPGFETDLYQFHAVAGEQYYFQMQSLTGGNTNGRWRLIDPYGQTVFTQALATDVDTLAVNHDGAYTLLVEGRVHEPAAREYAFHVQPVEYTEQTLSLGATISDALEVVGERDLYRFTISDTSLVYVDALTNSGSLTWTLAGPKGTLVSSRRFDQTDSADGLYVLDLVAGDYTLTVDGVGAATGDYSLQLVDLASVPVIVPGTPVSGELDPGFETDLYQFQAVAGDQFYFQMQSLTGGSTNGRWRLIDPYGQPLFTQGLAGDVETLAVHHDGLYTLLVEGRILEPAARAYTFQVQPVVYTEQTVALGETISDTLAVVGQRDLYRFTLDEPTLVYVDSLTNSSSLTWTLAGPTGTLVNNRRFDQTDSLDGLFVLDLAPGLYTLTVDGAGTATGDYGFRFLDLASAPAIVPGTPISGDLDPGLETDPYQLTAGAGDQFRFEMQSLTGGATNGRWRLIDPYGQTVFTQPLTSNVNSVTLGHAGAYALLVEGRIHEPLARSYTFQVDLLGNEPILPPVGEALTLGGTISGTVADAGGTNPYVFSLSDRTRVYFDALTNSSSLTWTLSGPKGILVNNRRFDQSDSYDGLFVLDLVPGTYTLTVKAAAESTDYRFRLVDLASATPLTLGTVVSDTLETGLETDLYRFPATAGERFYFQLHSLTGGATNGRWRLIDPFGQTLFTQSLAADVETLEANYDGTYTLLLEGRIHEPAARDYSFQVHPVVDADQTLELGTIYSSAIAVPGERDLYPFSLAERQLVYMDSLVNSNLHWTLTGPKGLLVNGRRFSQTDSYDGLFVLDLVPGHYTLTVDISGAFTGDYSFRLVDLASATTITPGTPVSGELAPGFETDLYQFQASAEAQFYFQMQSLTGGNTNGRWRLIDPYGQTVFTQSLALDVDTLSLSYDGLYTLLVEGRILEPDARTYTFQVQPVGYAEQSLTLGETISGTLEVVGERDLYHFTLSEPTWVYVDALTASSSLTWTLAGPKGTLVNIRRFDQTDSADGLFVLDLAAGDYTLTVDAVGAATGDYLLRLVNLASVAVIAPGTPVSGDLDPGLETDLYQFHAAAGDRFYFQMQSLTGGNTNGRWRLIDPYGQAVFTQSLAADVETLVANHDGPYTLLVEGRIVEPASRAYTFQVQPVVYAEQPLTLGETINDTLAVMGQRDLYRFTINEPTLVYVDSLISSSLTWTLASPTGTLVNARRFDQTDSLDGLFVLDLVAGPYTLTVDGSGIATGDYRFRLMDLASASTIALGTPVSGVLDPGLETELYRFHAMAGDQFNFRMPLLGGPQYVVSSTYGITVDSQGIIWCSGYPATKLIRLDPATGEVLLYDSPGGHSMGGGVAVDRQGNIWAASYNSSKMLKWEFAEDRKTLVNSLTVTVGRESKAATLDSEGYIWTTCLGDDRAYKIDPLTNSVVLSVPTGRTPYNYSDMTGAIHIGVTRPTGTWTEIVDSETPGQAWGTVWLEYQAPPRTDVRLRVRAADDRGVLGGSSWGIAQPGEPLHHLRGRFLEVEVTLSTSAAGSTPTVSEVFVAAVARPTIEIETPADESELAAGSHVVISGVASAATRVGSLSTTVPNRIVAALINGTAVDVLDASGRFFTHVPVLPGENVFDVTVIDAYGQTAATRWTIVGSQTAGGSVDLLYDVSPSFTPDYARTSFDERAGLLYAELAIRNVGDYSADKPFYVGIRNISDPTVLVQGAAGVTREGTPYYDFSPRISGTSLAPAEMTDIIHATFWNPHHNAFTYELVFLAKLNEPPVFDSTPIVETYIDHAYRYPAQAHDPDADPLAYALLSGPEGMNMDAATGQVTWLATETHRGVHPVILRVDDGRGGAAEQRYLLSVTEAPPNRPPYFVSLPVTEATVARDGQITYHYVAQANDPDFDALQFSLLTGPAGMQITPATGHVTWALTALQPGSHPVTIEVSDGRGGVGEQTFRIQVVSVPGNQPPVIVTEPNATAIADQSYVYDVEAADADGDTLTYSLTVHPDGMTIHEQTGRMSWTPGAQDVGSHVVTVQVTDGRGGFDLQTFSLLVAVVGSSEIRGTKFHDLDRNGVQDGRNVVSNFDFEWGSAGFHTDLVESTDLWSPNQFAIGRDPSSYHDAWASFGDHTTGTGLMMIINGATASHGVVWEQDVLVSPQTDYIFSVWAASSHGSSPALIQFYVNDQMIGEDLQLSSEVGIWQKLSAPWRSGDAETATVAIRNYTGAYGGNDFVLDDISFATTGASEPGLAGWTIYLDQNRNGRHDTGESYSITDAQGNHALTGLPPGEYMVAETLKAGWTQTAPLTKTHVVSLADGQILTGVDFGNSRITGANLPPEFTSSPPQVADVDQLLRYAATAFDPDNDPLTFDLSLSPQGLTVHPQRGIVVWQPTPEQVGKHQVILRVRDAAGGMALQNFTISVTRPNTAPVITSQPPTSAVAERPFEFQVAVQDADGDSVALRLEGAPAGMELQAQTGRGTWTPTAEQLGTHTFTIIASDGQTGDVAQPVVLEVAAAAVNDPPAIVSQPRLRARVGQPYGYGIVARDPNGDPLSFYLDAAPSGMSVDAAGVIRWQPAPHLLGTAHTVSIRVEDGRGGTATQAFDVEVVSQDANAAPRIVSVPPLTGVVGRTYRYDLAAQDPEGDPVVWSLEQAPTGMSIDPLRGTLRWTPTAQQAGAQNVIVRVQDLFFADSMQSFTLDVRAVNLPPAIQSSPPVSADPNTLYVYAPQARDPDGDALTFRLAAQPAGMTIDESTGLVRWTPTLTHVGSHTVRIVVEDGYGGVGSQAYTLHVGQQAVNHAPVITSTPVYHATVDRSYRYEVVARDPEGDTLVFALERFPDGMVIDAGTGLITWMPEADDLGDQTVTVTATDSVGARAAQTFILTIRPNQAPQISMPSSRAIAVGAMFRADVRAADPDGDPVTLVLAAGPAGLAMDPQGRITWRPAPGDVGAHTIAVTAHDPFGASDSGEFTVTVTADTEAPRVTLSASTSLVDRGGQIVFQVLATDNVAVEALTLTVGQDQVALDPQGRAVVTMDTPGVVDVTASATDAAGNVGTSTPWQVRVVDPDDQAAPQVEITAIVQGDRRIEGDELLRAPVISYVAELVGSVEDDNLEFWRLEYARADLVDLHSFAAADPDYVLIASGTANVDNQALGLFDPTLLANDSYVLRLLAGDTNGLINARGVTVNVSGEAKLGNLRLEFVDLVLPLGGTTVRMARTYDTLQSTVPGAFGFGWSLDVLSPNIRETVPPGTGLGLFSEGHPFVPEETRVYLTNPDGKRIGFTYYEVLIQAGLFTAIFAPRFRPDPGVYDQLEAPGTVIRGMFGWFDYNPDQYTLTRPDGSQYAYDQYQGLQTITDPLGNVVTVTAAGMSHSQGDSLEFIRDARGRIREIRGPATTPGGEPVRVLYEYDLAGDLVAVTNAVGETTRFVYRTSPAHFLDAIIDSRGVTVFRAEFDDSGRLTSSLDALGGRVSQDFDPAHFLGTITDARGNVTELLYNDRGNILEERVQDPYDSTRTLVTHYEYGDPRHPDQATKVVQRDGTVVEYAYDDAGRTAMESTVSADGHDRSTVVQRHDQRGNVAEFVDPLGNVTTFVYSAEGIPQSVVNAAGDVALLGFAGGRQTSFTDFNGHATSFEYAEGAPNGKPSKTVFADGSYEVRTWNRYYDLTSVQSYDADSRLLAVTTVDYDHLRRRIRETSGQGTEQVVITYEYEASTTNVTRETIVHPTDVSLSRVTCYEYDAAGRLVRRVDPDQDANDPAAGAFFKYDAHGNRVWLRDPVGNVTTWIYDSLNRVIEERDPRYWHGTDWSALTDSDILDLIGTPTPAQLAPYESSHVTRYVYDAADRVVEEIDRNGRRRTFAYDYLGNLVAEVWYHETDDTTALRQLTFTYDAASNLLSAADPDAAYAFTYDTRNRLETMTVDYPWSTAFDTFSLSYEYDGMGNIVAVTDSTGVAVNSTYHDSNRLASRGWEGISGADVRADFDYTALGRLAEVVRYSDLAGTQPVATTTLAYDQAGRPTSIVHAHAADEVLARYDYTYDSTGLLSRETLEHLTATYDRVADYRHDLRGRLVAAMYDNDQPDELFSYDAHGNRTMTGHVLGPANQLLSDGADTYTYDGEGNMLTRSAITPVAGEANYTEYQYDFRNRLTRVLQYSRAPGDGGIVLHEESYRYDALGRRVAVVSDGEMLISLYDGHSFLAHEWARFDADGDVVQRFLSMNEVDKLIAQWTRGEGVAWTLTDHLGTVRDLINNAAAFVQHIQYTAFGHPTFAAAGGNSHPHAFTGRVWDAIPGTSFHRARVYDPLAGRFLSQDPLSFDGGTLQLYEYANNLPTWHTDPSGKVSLVEYALINTFISTLTGAVFAAARGESPEDGAANGFVFGLLSSLTVGLFLAAGATIATVIISGMMSAAAGGFLDAANSFSGGRVNAEINRLIDENGGRSLPPEIRDFIRNVVLSAIF